MSEADTPRFLRTKDVLAIVPVSKPTLWRMTKVGDFPKPVSIGASKMWLESEVRAWMQYRMDNR